MQRPTPVDADDDAAHARLLPQINLIVRALLGSPVGKRLLLLASVLLLVIVATTYGQIRLNRWNKPFYDALSRRDFTDFLYQLGVFFVIAGALLILNVAQRWVIEMLKLKLREGLVLNLLRDWMRPRRALMLANAGSIGINPDQRMHEDTRHLCELSADLGSGLLQSSILLVTFVGVLWVISSPFVLRIAEHDYAIPGYMVWAALLYAAIGSLMSYWVGRSLIPRNAERYAQEADLRFSLVRVNEHLDGISLAGGEAGETRRVEQHLASVLAAMRRLVSGLTNLTWVTAGFGWITLVAPIIVAAPLYFQGTLSFGGLMMAAAAFQQTQSSLRWFVDNFSVIADWRATLLRVASFRRALLMVESLGESESRISYEDGQAGEVVLEELEVVSVSGRDMIEERSVKIRRGERLLIVAHQGTSKTQLFRALAGLWPWGSGRIVRPKDEPIFYLPRGTPYLPRGSLREVLAYPKHVEDFTESAYLHALRRMGLERLIPMLPETLRWEQHLSQDEQLSLAIARIVLQRPPWLVVDDVFDSLDRETLERVVDIFASELEHTSVIQIRSSALRDPLYSRLAHLIKVPSGSPSNARRVALPLALLCGVLLLWPALRPAAAAEPLFQFRAPTVLSDAATTAAMRDLALRLLPVYQDLDRDRYLATLSALQMVEGDYGAAYGARVALRQRLKGQTPAQPIEQSVVYDIYAHTKVLETQQHEPFGRAFSQAFNAVIPRLDDLTDYAMTSWFSTPLSVFQAALQSALASVQGQKSITQRQALDLIWAYLAYEVHLNTGPQADELIAEDDQFRYIIDDQILIRLPNGIRVPVMVVRPRGAAARLATLLEFTIYRDNENYAKECAAHGYAGVVGYTSGRLPRHLGVLPFERDGSEARAVIAWIARQPWSDGRVGMYGSGYSAFAAWAAAKHAPAALKAIATSSALAPGVDAPMLGNIFVNAWYRWAHEATADPPFNPISDEDESFWRQLNQTWYRSGRPYDQLDALAGVPNPLFDRWLEHPSYDRYWQQMIPYRDEFARIHIPMLAVTGYYAADAAGTLYYFAEHERYAPRDEQTLLIGPYDEQAMEQGASATLRGYRLDAAALIDLRDLRYRWFDSVLRGAPRPSLLQGRINFEVSGANEWRHAGSIEAMTSRTLRFYLSPAASDLPASAEAHVLAAQKPAKLSALEQSVNLAERADADWNAPPELQSAALPTHYSVVFATGALPQAIELSGEFSGQLELAVNRADVDLALALYERLPDGTYLKLFDPQVQFRASYLRDPAHRALLKRGARQQLQFHSNRLLSRSFAAGSRLVLVLSVNKRPDQEINYGSGKAVATESISAATSPLKIRWFSSSYIDVPAE
jgi:putative CocE/NonD family hydrolase